MPRLGLTADTIIEAAAQMANEIGIDKISIKLRTWTNSKTALCFMAGSNSKKKRCVQPSAFQDMML